MASACRVVKTKTSECHQPRKYCPNTEFFLVCIFPYLELRRRFTPSIFSPNPGKYEPEKTLSLHNFYTVAIISKNKAKQEMLRNLTIAMILR